MSSISTCIYCKQQNKPFDREHVIPEAFGTFDQNFVLHNCVCMECNSYFGRELDLILSRDSGEALLRLRHEIKPVSEARDLRNTRVKLKVNVPGPWYGTQIILRSDSTGMKLDTEQLPQVGFRKLTAGSADFTWYAEEELTEPSRFERYREGTEIRIVGPSEKAMQRLTKRLEQLGIPFKYKGIIEQPFTENGKVETVALDQIDQIILRAVGKIGFNYVAHTQGVDFSLRDDFDDFRSCVRYGQEPQWKPAIVPTTNTVLYDDNFRWRQTFGHLITFGWNRDDRGLVVQISLFNSVTYRALLCRYFSRLWLPLSSGHHFDIESRTISRLGSATLVRFRTA